MPTIRERTTLAAGERAFPLQGSQYEYLPFDARVEFAVVETTTVPVDDITATVYSGTDVLQQRAIIDSISGAPKYPDDFLLDDVAAAGERLSVELESVLGGDVTTIVKITPL